MSWMDDSEAERAQKIVITRKVFLSSRVHRLDIELRGHVRGKRHGSTGKKEST